MDAIKSVIERIRQWLIKRFDLVDGKTYRELATETTVALHGEHSYAMELRRLLSSVTVLNIGIPATTATWYEDATFSEKVWSALKDKYVSIEEQDDKKVATIIVLNPECADDIS